MRVILRMIAQPRIISGYFLAIAALFFLVKLILAIKLSSPDLSYFNVGFGFTNYVRSLADSGVFASCEYLSCDRAGRMPLLPVLYALMGYMGAQTLLHIAIIKGICMFMLALAAIVHSGVFRAYKRDGLIWPFVCGMLVISPVVIKNASSVNYEEGILIELLFIHALYFSTIIVDLAKHNFRISICIAFIATTIALYYLKSSMLVVVVYTTMICAFLCFREGLSRTALVLTLSVVVGIGAWGVRNHIVTDRFAIGSSYDGENLFRGWNGEGYQIYPYVSLDRLMDSKEIRLQGMETVQVPHNPGRSEFDTEWEWKDYYVDRALSWGVAHPKDAVGYTLKKAHVLMLDLEWTPRGFPVGEKKRAYGSNIETISRVSMGLVRLASLFLVVAAVNMLIKRQQAMFVLIAGGYLLSYMLPYLIGFAYQRHTAPLWLAMTAFLCVYRALRAETVVEETLE